MPFRLARRADTDLAALYRWGVLNFGPTVSNEYYDGLLALCGLLAENPQIARAIRNGVRAHPYRSHIIILKTFEDGIDILQIRHGMSNWRRYL